MADWAIYWSRYRMEMDEDSEPATGWLTNRDWLVKRLHRGDRIWLFIGGNACGDTSEPHRGYLVQLFVVDGYEYYEEYEPGVRGSPQYRILGVAERCVLFDPPALADDILRQPGKHPSMHIGTARQTPFQLDDGQVARLLELVKAKYPKVYAAAVEA